jgi:hypothetical protein
MVAILGAGRDRRVPWRLSRLGDVVIPSPLETPGWIEFNTWRTGLTAHHVTAGGAGGDNRLNALLYVDRRGRVVMPPNNPYLPIRFETDRANPASRTAAWIRASRILLDEMNERGVVNQIHWPPGITDMRPFAWDGYLVGVRYTYVLDLPLDERRVSRNTRSLLHRIESSGVTVERTDDIDAVMSCLEQSEMRRSFAHGLGRRELEAAARIMGPDTMRMQVAFDRSGRPASALVNLHVPGGRAIGWLFGNSPTALRDKTGIAILRHEFSDLAAAGATSVDLCGANIESVATFKSHWGAELVPTFDVRDYSLRATGRYALDWRDARALRRHARTQRRASGMVAPTGTPSDATA